MLSVNDGNVMEAWKNTFDDAAGNLRFVADPFGSVTKALGFGYMSGSLGGLRCRRFAALIDDATIKVLDINPDGGSSCSLAPDFIDKI